MGKKNTAAPVEGAAPLNDETKVNVAPEEKQDTVATPDNVTTSANEEVKTNITPGEKNTIAPTNVEGATIIKETDTIIFFKANKPLDEGQYDLLDRMVRLQNDRTGLKIVLVPFSADLK